MSERQWLSRHSPDRSTIEVLHSIPSLNWRSGKPASVKPSLVICNFQCFAINYLVCVQNNLAGFGVGTSDNHQAIQCGTDADKRTILVVAQNMARSMFQQVQASLVDSQPQTFGPIGSE